MDDAGPDHDPGFDYVARVPVRYRDLDAEGHANNAVYATYLEEARLGYFRDVVGVDLRDERRVLAALSVEFRRRIADGPVAVAVRVTDLGESSLTLRYEVRLPGESAETGDGSVDASAASGQAPVAATGETVLVTVDGDGDSRPLPSPWRERIAAHEGIEDAPSREE